jgi:hypothetical protein
MADNNPCNTCNPCTTLGCIDIVYPDCILTKIEYPCLGVAAGVTGTVLFAAIEAAVCANTSDITIINQEITNITQDITNIYQEITEIQGGSCTVRVSTTDPSGCCDYLVNKISVDGGLSLRINVLESLCQQLIISHPIIQHEAIDVFYNSFFSADTAPYDASGFVGPEAGYYLGGLTASDIVHEVKLRGQIILLPTETGAFFPETAAFAVAVTVIEVVFTSKPELAETDRETVGFTVTVVVPIAEQALLLVTVTE